MIRLPNANAQKYIFIRAKSKNKSKNKDPLIALDQVRSVKKIKIERLILLPK